jgi:hypothetical protein
VKCIMPLCASDSQYSGYCKTHHQRRIRGSDMDAPIRPYRLKNPRPPKLVLPAKTVLLVDVIDICENGGSMVTGTDLAALFRRLRG